ncbi:MAG TPA: DUF3857 domain-containing protein [Ideonella sp.]|jgi:lipoprotein NlpI/transglutaminase-like putative cysteine protease|nr:DUF3857 domain-containing protein [Ideonella sp.]
MVVNMTPCRRHLRLLLLCLAAGALPALAATAPAVPAAAATKPAAKPAGKPAAAAADFTIEPVPAWVQPVPVDPALVAAMPKAALQFLLLDRQTRVDRNEETHFSRWVRQITESGGLEAGSQLQIEFDPSYQTLALHKLELVRNGQRIDKLDRRKVQLLQRESQLERQIVDGRRTASVVMDDVRVGDRIEFAYTLRGANPVFEGKFVDTEWTVAGKGPAALVHYRLLAPEARDIHLRADPARHQVTSELKSGWRETIVRRTAAPQFQYDAHAPASAYLADQLQLSEFADWADVARWAARVFAPANRAPAAPVRAQAESLAQAAGATPAERTRRTLDFVQNEVRYFGTEIGANTHQPAEPEQVLKQRFGDCKDKATLLVALLRVQGIGATPLLVSTALHGDVNLLLPSPLAFNHVITRVEVGDKAWLLDGTRAHQTGPLAERESHGLGFGLLADERTAALSALPDSRADLHIDAEDRVVFTKLSEDPTLEARLIYHGDFAENLRYALDGQPASELEKRFAGDYARAYQGAELTAPMQLEEVDGHNALRVRLQFKLPNFFRLYEHKSLLGDYGLPAVTEELRLPDQVPRKLPMRLGTPGVYRHSVEFSFPEEVYSRIEREPFDKVDRNLELHTLIEGRRESARFSAELRLTNEHLAAADWAAHRELLIKLWPKIAGSVSVPTLSARQSKLLVERLNTLADEAKRGVSKLKTGSQVEAQSSLWIAQARLDSGRLPPRLRAQMLVEAGMQQDNLGQLAEAAASFNEALSLDPRNSEAHAALSVNALLRQEEAQAIAHATQALELAPGDTAPRYTRAFAQYYAGHAAEARDELLEILKNRSDVDRSYATVWLHLATRRLGGDAVAATRAYQPSDSTPAWPYPVVQLLNGSGSLDQALAAARADKKTVNGRLCELYFFLGQQQLLDGQTQAARESFQKAVNTGVTEYTEYALAQRELQRLTGR